MSCFLFLSNFVVQYGCTVRYGPLAAIICGHSFCKRLQVDMQAGTDARMRPTFKLEGTARVRMLGKGGKTIGDFVRRDIPVIQRYRPDILILLLGDNDIGCDTSADYLSLICQLTSEDIKHHFIIILSVVRQSMACSGGGGPRSLRSQSGGIRCRAFTRSCPGPLPPSPPRPRPP